MGNGAATNQNSVYSKTKMRNLFLNNKRHVFAILQAVFLYSKQSTWERSEPSHTDQEKTLVNLLGKAQYVTKIPI